MINETVCTEFATAPEYFLWLTYTAESGAVYYVVSDRLRTEYYLFKGKRKLSKKSSNPSDLYAFMK